MKESGFSAFCKKVPKCESQTSSGEVADLSDFVGKTICEGESAWLLVLRLPVDCSKQVALCL